MAEESIKIKPVIDVFLVFIDTWTFLPRQAMWMCREVWDTTAVAPLYNPLAVGVCKVPPRGRTYFEYKPLIHGPLVDCRYDTAVYG